MAGENRTGRVKKLSAPRSRGPRPARRRRQARRPRGAGAGCGAAPPRADPSGSDGRFSRLPPASTSRSCATAERTPSAPDGHRSGGGLHVPVPLVAADPAREGVRGRERHGLMPAGAARESRGRIRAGGSGPHGMRGDGGVTRTAGSGSGACRGRYGGGTGQRCAPGHRVLPGVRAGRPARFCRWPPADSVPRAGAPGRKLSGSAPPDVIRDISHWPRAVREGWRGAVGVWRRDAPRRP